MSACYNNYVNDVTALYMCVHANRSCPSGAGEYTLKTTHAEELGDCMLSMTKR